MQQNYRYAYPFSIVNNLCSNDSLVSDNLLFFGTYIFLFWFINFSIRLLWSYIFLSSAISINDDSHGTNAESPPGSGSIQGEISQYLGELRTLQPRAADALAFWNERRATYSKLAPIAEDLLAAPASQAFVERIFSLCGWLTAGRRNRMQKSLEMRVFLKLNRDLLAH
jgi:hypothetical protein